VGKSDTKDLLKFLKPFPTEKAEMTLWLRDLVWDLYPEANELIYDNYNALAFGWSITDKLGDTFCTMAIGRTSLNVHFGFYWGSKISDPKKLLLGNGNQYRYLLVKSKEGFPLTYAKKLMNEAYRYSVSKIKKPMAVSKSKPAVKGLTMTKSISAAKRTKKATEKTTKKSR
jgi:hypothetical protein